nr:hypothetical protein Iba_chr05aCG12510 [Ipomoea batatas]GMD01769.1 hypothetical protein Iba_chr05fCG10330 [Ipomoea batatas]GMD41158.1 hypothetical protein Iba_chr10aCG16350 [Ipomoea batatas]GMD41159.1 hypothetical protein Iba_chr10aCG16360 [Ipomoea batatas]GME01758.1 hypothetical protein Iba_scaffold590158CG0010 [Ipomoea batatas]
MAEVVNEPSGGLWRSCCSKPTDLSLYTSCLASPQFLLHQEREFLLRSWSPVWWNGMCRIGGLNVKRYLFPLRYYPKGKIWKLWYLKETVLQLYF